jgi:phosphatidate cytidylyltransferase
VNSTSEIAATALPVADRTVSVTSSVFFVRVVSAIALAIPTLAAVAWGRPVFEAWLALFVVLMAREWHELCGGRGWSAARVSLAVLVLIVLVLATIDRYQAALGVTFLGTPIVYLLSRREQGGRPGFISLGLCYIGLPALSLSWLRAIPESGLLNLVWVLGVVWATDTAAYITGRVIGGPKLAPAVSPGKTWSGSFGGLIGAAIVGAGMASAVGSDLWLAVLASLPLSVVAQAGDLAESGVKRRFGVKDSGSIIPGHGGVFDRADALLAAAPAAALTLSMVGADALWR